MKTRVQNNTTNEGGHIDKQVLKMNESTDFHKVKSDVERDQISERMSTNRKKKSLLHHKYNDFKKKHTLVSYMHAQD